jgi:hypothetical protein
MKNIKIVLDPFCYRQFDKTKSNIFINYDMKAFADKINDYYLNTPNCLKDGYAPFCKHIFIKNFTDMPANYLKINEEYEKLIKTVYEARTEKELPVLRRYISFDSLNLVPSDYLDIILYSKEQITIENKAMGNIDPNENIDYEYGIISVKPQNTHNELPMDPITMMRNALGVNEGGSGIPLDREKYMDSVQFWSENVIIK